MRLYHGTVGMGVSECLRMDDVWPTGGRLVYEGRMGWRNGFGSRIGFNV